MKGEVWPWKLKNWLCTWDPPDRDFEHPGQTACFVLREYRESPLSAAELGSIDLRFCCECVLRHPPADPAGPQFGCVGGGACFHDHQDLTEPPNMGSAPQELPTLKK